MRTPQESPYAAGNDSKINVAVQRPTVNLREAENVGEQAAAAARVNEPPFRFSKHGTFGKTVTHPGLE
jgi:hypothetical protein